MTTLAAIRFTVLGQAQPAGSKRALPLNGKLGGRAIIVDANRKSAPWKSHVAAVARQHYAEALLRGPLSVTFLFFTPRPAGHIGRKGNVLPSAPMYPTVRPDVLKLARGCEDALTGVLWHDDAQIVQEHLEKRYGEPARVEVLVEPL